MRARLSPWALGFSFALVALLWGLLMAPIAHMPYGGWGMTMHEGWFGAAPILGLLTFVVWSGVSGLLVGWFYNLALDWRNR